jgi:uncharacterized protein YdeI (YjbR/CyaY-like superfamily)
LAGTRKAGKGTGAARPAGAATAARPASAAPLMVQMAGREQWRRWLARHHASHTEVWLVYFKRHTGRPTVVYEEAVQEALCFGWIDSIVRRVNDQCYAQKFTPRRARSQWSSSNLRRFALLVREGRMTAAGLAKGPPPGGEAQAAGGAADVAAVADRSDLPDTAGAPVDPSAGSAGGDPPASAKRRAGEEVEVPAYMKAELRTHPGVWQAFSRLAPSHRRNYVRWVDSAKRQETRERRLAEAVALLEKNRKLGMK